MNHPRCKTRILFVALFTCICSSTVFAEDLEPKQTLFTHVNVFNGTDNRLYENHNVLIEGNLIKAISDKEIKTNANATVVDGKGRTLMPGLIDMHSHLAVSANSLVEYENTPWDALGARTALVAEDTLMDGFTTVRDVGGMHGKGIKLMIDSGELPGPRIFPSGGFIGATSSHADLRMLTMRNPNLEGTLDSNLLRLEVGYITDGVDDVLAASRRNFQMGASQLKLMIGGGVATEYDPWHSTTFTYDEIKAAVDVAQGYGSYVTAHINQPESMQLAIKAGVSCIEHGFVMDEETMKLLVDKGVWLSAQMTGTSRELAELPSLTPENLRKLNLAHGQIENFIPLVKKYKPKQVFAVDAVLASRDNYKRQRQHEIYMFANIFGNFEMLKAATSSAGELLAQTKQTTYHAGKIGVVEKGAYADLLLVDGNPLKDITVIGGNELWLKAPVPKPIESIRMIMKDGVIYKNTL
ncbi:TPA: amidohydrolase family protein [Vibrio parahaemolyticus]